MCQAGQVAYGWRLYRSGRGEECLVGPSSTSRPYGEASANHGRWHRQAQYFIILRNKEFTSRILLAQFPKQFLREGNLLFTARGKGKEDFGERSQVATVLSSLGHLLHAELFVSVNSIEPEHEVGTGGLRSDNVVCYAKCDISIYGIRMPASNDSLLSCASSRPALRRSALLWLNRSLGSIAAARRGSWNNAASIFYLSSFVCSCLRGGLSSIAIVFARHSS